MPSSDPSPLRIVPGPPGWLHVDVFESEGNWGDADPIAAMLVSAAAALVRHPGIAPKEPCEACIALSDDAAVRALNATYRGMDKPTNVLSFPSPEAPPSDGPAFLGDVVIALETVRREAGEKNITFEDHLQHLAVHGLLHLLGYDHETDGEAQVMERLETEILADLGIADPYDDRDAPAPADGAVSANGL